MATPGEDTKEGKRESGISGRGEEETTKNYKKKSTAAACLGGRREKIMELKRKGAALFKKERCVVKRNDIDRPCFLSGSFLISPMSGMDSEVSGIFSAMASMKTEKASRTVTPRAIFSPESGGRQNTSTVSVDIIMHGNTMLYLRQVRHGKKMGFFPQSFFALTHM